MIKKISLLKKLKSLKAIIDIKILQDIEEICIDTGETCHSREKDCSIDFFLTKGWIYEKNNFIGSIVCTLFKWLW
jgi:hypothetical protein